MWIASIPPKKMHHPGRGSWVTFKYHSKSKSKSYQQLPSTKSKLESTFPFFDYLKEHMNDYRLQTHSIKWGWRPFGTCMQQ